MNFLCIVVLKFTRTDFVVITNLIIQMVYITNTIMISLGQWLNVKLNN